MGMYDCTYADMLDGRQYDDNTPDQWGTRKVALVPIHPDDMGRLVDQYGAHNLSHYTYFLVLHGVDGVDEGELDENIEVIPVASDLTSEWDTPLIECGYSDRAWMDTIMNIVSGNLLD